jgi:hypothetical protein
MKRWTLLLVVWFELWSARAAPAVPDPVRLIDASGVEIRLYAPVMRDREQARALRRAVVERGVRVTILSEPESAREASSYLPSLKLAGVSVFVARVPRGERGLLIVDGRVAVSGVGLGRLSLPYERGLRFEATSNIPALNAWFLNSIRTARALSVSSLIGR